MPAAERAEVQAILDRVGDIGESHEQAKARNKILLDMAYAESKLLEILDRGQPPVKDGQVVTDPDTGEPVRDPDVEREARRELRDTRAFRNRLARLPGDDEAQEADV
jgi:hypothetical protein